MELEEAIKDIKVWLDFPVWFIHTGKDEDFLRRIDKSAIETLLNHLTKQEKMIESAKDRIEYYLMGNSTLEDFNVRERELEKLLKILNKAEESE